MEKANEKIDEIMQQLSNGIKDVMTSERYKEFLNVMGSFYNYSFNNQILIMKQMPAATNIASFTFWKKLERHVKRGEKGIKILAPNINKVTESIIVKDKEGKPVMVDGRPLTEDVISHKLTGFRIAYVFDVSQTSGKALPTLTTELHGTSPTAEKLLHTLEKVIPFPIETVDFSQRFPKHPTAKGCFNFTDQTIYLNEKNEPIQNVKTLIHEYAHGIEHQDSELSKMDKEIQAESTAYVVSNYFGIDTSEYSFDYVSGWAYGKDVKEIQTIMENVRTTIKGIIEQVNYELVQEHLREEIETMLKKADIEPTEKLVNNILEIDTLAGKSLSIDELQSEQIPDAISESNRNVIGEKIKKLKPHLKSSKKMKQKKIQSSKKAMPSKITTMAAMQLQVR